MDTVRNKIINGFYTYLKYKRYDMEDRSRLQIIGAPERERERNGEEEII